jgi:Rieske Fe-S protein
MPLTLNRRDLICGCLAAAAGPSLCSAASPERCCTAPEAPPGSVNIEAAGIEIDLQQARQLAGKGGSLRIVDKARDLNVVVAHVDQGRYAAFDGRCTHGGGPLVYLARRRVLHCTCWGHSQFDLQGAVVAGPAKKKLRVHGTRLEGHLLTVVLEPRV